MVLAMIQDDSKTRFERSSPLIGIAIGLLVQFVGGVYWAGTLSASIGALQEHVARLDGQFNASNQNEFGRSEKVARIDERTTDILNSIADLKAHIAAIETTLAAGKHGR